MPPEKNDKTPHLCIFLARADIGTIVNRSQGCLSLAFTPY